MSGHQHPIFSTHLIFYARAPFNDKWTTIMRMRTFRGKRWFNAGEARARLTYNYVRTIYIVSNVSHRSYNT